MHEWSLKSNDPLSLTLVSDARTGPTDYLDDHIWELAISSGDPPGLSLQTTYGLRARIFRILPRFSEGDLIVMNPGDYAAPIQFLCLYPNFISLFFSPFPEIDVIAEYWVPEPHCLAGRYTFKNRSGRDRTVRLEILGQLSPTSGQRMAPMEIQASWVLAGQTGDLYPLIFLTGGPLTGTGSYPSLLHAIDLSPGDERQIIWTSAARPSLDASFELARLTAARKWDAERSYLDLLNGGQVEIYTGNSDWDAAFMLAQRAAYSLIVGPTESLSAASFVLTRQPDQGFSLLGDGSDYNHLWNGQSALEAYYLSTLLIPSSTSIVEGVLRNFLAIQSEDGFIDWKPGLAGQRSSILSTPILAELAWRIFESTRDRKFIEEVFPGLLKFFHSWFKSAHDRDYDGIPEWDHPAQSGLEDHPVFSRWHEWSFGVEISTTECPGLNSFLYRECQCLIQMAGLLEKIELIPELQVISERLRLAVEIAWDAERGSYLGVDRDTHFTTKSEKLGELAGPGTLIINRKFDQPVRLLVHTRSSDDSSRRVRLIIHGVSATGQPRLERIAEERFKWFLGRGVFTGERVYQDLEQVEVQGLQSDDVSQLYTVGYDYLDQSSLLPLWAGIPDDQRAKVLIEQNITNHSQFWRSAGLPTCPEPPVAPDATACQSVNLLWNSLIGGGLIRYGYRNIAAELVVRLMKVIIQSLKESHAFRRYYHAETGKGVGERDPLQGLAPLGFFLDTLGVRLMSPHRVMLTGFNPFPWPVTVKYRGITILRQKDKTTVIFPDGQTVTVDDPAPQVVALEIDQN